MITINQTDRGTQYDVRLTGSITNLLVVGVVGFLRDRAILRALTGTLGFLCLAAGAFLFLFKYILVDEFMGRLSTPLIAGGFIVTISAILSGPRFNLFIGDPPEVEERRVAEESLGESRDPYESLELDAKRLSEYYAINQAQARGSFRWAVFAMFCGLSTIVGGIWVFYLRQQTPDTFMASLSTAAGVVVNLISGLYLYLHNKTQQRSLLYYSQLVRIQHLGLAIRLAESHPTEEARITAKDRVIGDILNIARSSADQDVVKARKEAA